MCLEVVEVVIELSAGSLRIELSVSHHTYYGTSDVLYLETSKSLLATLVSQSDASLD